MRTIIKHKIIDFYREELFRQGKNRVSELDTSNFPKHIPKNIYSLGIKVSDIIVSKYRNREDIIKFYKSELEKQGVSIHNLDKSNFPKDIPKSTSYFNIKINKNKKYRSRDEVIEFYKKEMSRQGVYKFNHLDFSFFPSDIPKYLSYHKIKTEELTVTIL